MAQRLDNRQVKHHHTGTLEGLIAEKDQEVTRVRSEYYRLVEQWKSQVKDKQDVVEQLTMEDTQKMRQLLLLRNKILDFEKKNEKLTNETVKNMENTVNELKTSTNDKLKNGQVAVSEVTENINQMEDIQRKSLIYEFKLLEWRNNCTQLDDKITRAKYENQIDLARMKLEIETEYEEQLEKFQQKASQEAQRTIQTIEGQIHDENQKLTLNTIAQRHKLEKQKTEIEEQKDKNRRIQREIAINQGTEDEYSKRANLQTNRIKACKNKIQILEKSLAQTVANFEKEKEMVRYQHESIIKDQREEIINARENLRVKNKELRNIRALAQVVLDQRSEVEQFFLEALEQIKEEIRKKNVLEKKQKKQVTVPGTNSQFQGTNSLDGAMGGHGQQSTQSQDPTKAFSDKVDLNDLEWEDRERVLRLLFSKMNAGVQTNSLQARQTANNAQDRQQDMQAMSEQQVPGSGDDMAHNYRQQYGEAAFNKYMEEESQKSEYDQQQQDLTSNQEDQDEEPLAIEYRE